MVQIDEAAAVRRLLDRFGLGAGGGALEAAQRRGYDATLRRLLRPSGTDHGVRTTPAPAPPWLPRPVGARAGSAPLKAWRKEQRDQIQELVVWWTGRMVAAEQPLRERMTWFWHGHFATSSQKVHSAHQMYAQNATFRRSGLGRFGTLAQALAVDPAMLVWLDGNDNAAAAPNENLSREFMELFSLGQGHFSEDDVKSGARALTGWTIDKDTGAAVFRPRRHATGDKTFLGVTADLDTTGFVDTVLAQSASARFVAVRVWFRLVSPTPPSTATLDRLVTAYGKHRDVTALLGAVAQEKAFRDSDAALVKPPVEWLVGLLRALDPGTSGQTFAALPDATRKKVLAGLRGMGQVPFSPPSVGGWPAGGSWLTTSAALSRVEVARAVTAALPPPADVVKASTRTRPDAVRRQLGIDRLTSRTRDAIAAVADRPALALTVGACAPEFTVSA